MSNKRLSSRQSIRASVLNDAEPTGSATKFDAQSIAGDLRSRILELYVEFLHEDGSAVNYEGLSKSPKFQDYKRVANQLKHVDPATFDRQERIAFFLNVYNALLIHAMVDRGNRPPSNLLARLAFYANSKYNIGGNIYSLNDIENGVLRSNRKSAVPFSKKPFGPGDPRLAVALDNPPDERIHFALNCGAKSCPPVRFFSSENLDDALMKASFAFVMNQEEGMRILDERQPPVVELSSIFKWYKEDFSNDSSDRALLERVCSYLEMNPDLQSRLRNAISQRAKVKYMSYDWSLNSSS